MAEENKVPSLCSLKSESSECRFSSDANLSAEEHFRGALQR
jgi:hypothetical protein